MKVELGCKAKDIITGFSGVVIGITQWMYGCRRIGIRPTELRDGKPIETEWFDEPQVEVTDKFLSAKVSARPSSPAEFVHPGGPREDPSQTRMGERP